MWLNGPGPQIRGGSLNRDATIAANADATAAKKTWILKSFSRIT